MLDEIINYVQSLQQEVESLSMKLSTVNLEMDFNMEDILLKDIYQSWVPLKHESSGCISSTFPYLIYIVT